MPMTRRGAADAALRLFLSRCYPSGVHEQDPCDECLKKRLACEQRAARWIQTLAWVDDEIGLTINFLDYHRARSERRAYIEALRKRLVRLREEMK